MHRDAADAEWLKDLQTDVDTIASKTRALVSGADGMRLSRRGHAELVWARAELELAADHLEFAEAYAAPEPGEEPYSESGRGRVTRTPHSLARRRRCRHGLRPLPVLRAVPGRAPGGPS